MQRIKEITVIGRGNVGSHLLQAFEEAGFKVRSQEARAEFQSESLTSDLILIAVKDNYISEVVEKIAAIPFSHDGRQIVAHTSGSVPMSALSILISSKRSVGVVYPMQTFTKGVGMRYDDIPFMIEGSDADTLHILMELARSISCNVMEADSATREKYHIGAVLTCNFANHLNALAEEFLQSEGLDYKYLLPLLRQTTDKLMSTSPKAAQTGPAVRGDHAVINRHLNTLAEYPTIAEIYRLLSDSIMKFHNPN